MRDRDASCYSQLPLIACAHSGMSKCDSIHKQKKELIYVLWLQRLTTRDIGPRLPPLFLSIRLDRLGYQSCETLLQCSQAGVLTKLDFEGGNPESLIAWHCQGFDCIGKSAPRGRPTACAEVRTLNLTFPTATELRPSPLSSRRRSGTVPLALTFWFAYLSFWLDARYCYETVARFAKCPGSETESVNAAALPMTYAQRVGLSKTSNKPTLGPAFKVASRHCCPSDD